MQTLTERIRGMEIDLKVREAITEYYNEIGEPEPNWRRSDCYDWWYDYLRQLEDESNK